MNALLLEPPKVKLLPDNAKPFFVVVAYDDSLARRKAMELYARLAQTSGNEFDFDCGWWSFEQLRQPYISDETASLAAAADMLMIVAAGSEDLPNHIKLWVETWLGRKGEQDTALVVMIGVTRKQEQPATAAHAYLSQVAREANLSYFPSQFQVAKPMPACTIEAILARAETMTPLLEGILHSPPPPRWGINE